MCRVDSSSDHRPRSVCPRTGLPNPCWKHLSWHPSFCVPCLESCLALARAGSSNGSGLMHRPESPLRGGVHDAIGWSGDQPWSGWVKRTSASHRLLKSYAPLFVPHRSLGGRKWEGARSGVAESLSEKKAILERREARLKLSVRAISPAEGGISVGFPQAWYTFSVSVIRVQGRPAHLTMTARHLQQRRFKLTILEALLTDARWLQGMTEYASWVQQEVQSDCWGVSTADPGIREESYAPPILARYGGWIDIGSFATAVDWFIFLS